MANNILEWDGTIKCKQLEVEIGTLETAGYTDYEDIFTSYRYFPALGIMIVRISASLKTPLSNGGTNNVCRIPSAFNVLSNHAMSIYSAATNALESLAHSSAADTDANKISVHNVGSTAVNAGRYVYITGVIVCSKA